MAYKEKIAPPTNTDKVLRVNHDIEEWESLAEHIEDIAQNQITVSNERNDMQYYLDSLPKAPSQKSIDALNSRIQKSGFSLEELMDRCGYLKGGYLSEPRVQCMIRKADFYIKRRELLSSRNTSNRVAI